MHDDEIDRKACLPDKWWTECVFWIFNDCRCWCVERNQRSLHHLHLSVNPQLLVYQLHPGHHQMMSRSLMIFMVCVRSNSGICFRGNWEHVAVVIVMKLIMCLLCEQTTLLWQILQFLQVLTPQLCMITRLVCTQEFVELDTISSC